MIKTLLIKNMLILFLEHHEHDLDVIGRYLVISKNGDKSYVSLRTKKILICDKICFLILQVKE